MAEHVFVETNWVVDHVAPVLSRGSGASELYELAKRGEITLWVPAISLVEARKVIRDKSPREDLNAIRAFVRRSRDGQRLDVASAEVTLDVLSRFKQYVRREKSEAPKRIEALTNDPVLHVYPLDAEMLERSTALAGEPGVELQSKRSRARGLVLHTRRRSAASEPAEHRQACALCAVHASGGLGLSGLPQGDADATTGVASPSAPVDALWECTFLLGSPRPTRGRGSDHRRGVRRWISPSPTLPPPRRSARSDNPPAG